MGANEGGASRTDTGKREKEGESKRAEKETRKYHGKQWGSISPFRRDITQRSYRKKEKDGDQLASNEQRWEDGNRKYRKSSALRIRLRAVKEFEQSTASRKVS